MNSDSISEVSKTDWEQIEGLEDCQIDLSDTPEITDEQMRRAVLRLGGKSLERGKIRVNMYLDAEIVAHYKALAGGRGYQTLINESLKDNIRAEDLEIALRRIIREELQMVTG